MQICQPKRLLSHPKDKDLPIWRHAAFVNFKAWHKGNNLNKTENVLWISIIFIQYKGAGGASETDEFSEGSKRPLPPYTPHFRKIILRFFLNFMLKKPCLKVHSPPVPKRRHQWIKNFFFQALPGWHLLCEGEGSLPKNLDSDEIFKP